jgi:flagellar protein FlgJ
VAVGANGPDDKERAAIRKAAVEFESFFLQMMFREMRKTTFNENGFLPKSNAEKIFTDMMDEQVANSSAGGDWAGRYDLQKNDTAFGLK